MAIVPGSPHTQHQRGRANSGDNVFRPSEGREEGQEIREEDEELQEESQ